ncbi:Hypothetical protein HVR_LOCUS257 [uncultured virus]|nr:Hypothetical protein HVR_LOCUS257 [uncultured virus]
MSRTVDNISARSYRDSVGSQLISAGTGITANLNTNGSYTISSSKPIYSLTTTTNSGGTATINLTSYGFASSPIVQTTCVATNSSQFTGCLIQTLSATSLTIKSYQTQNTSVIIGGNVVPVTPVAATVHISLFTP